MTARPQERLLLGAFLMPTSEEVSGMVTTKPTENEKERERQIQILEALEELADLVAGVRLEGQAPAYVYWRTPEGREYRVPVRARRTADD